MYSHLRSRVDVRNWPISCAAFGVSYVNHISRMNTTMGTAKMTYICISIYTTQRIPDYQMCTIVRSTRPRRSSFVKPIKMSYL